MQYGDSTKPIPQIATELGLGTVLEGGVQRAGNQVRINVQLIDAATDWLTMSWLGWLYLDLGDPDSVAYWHRRALEAAPDDVVPDIAYEWQVHQGDYESALALARSRNESGWIEVWPREVLAHLLLKAGRTDEARTRFANAYPGLFDEQDPQVEGDMAEQLMRLRQRREAGDP